MGESVNYGNNCLVSEINRLKTECGKTCDGQLKISNVFSARVVN